MIERAHVAANKARDLMDTALQYRDNIAQIRIRFMMHVVQYMYIMLKLVKANRALAEDLFGGEPGLAVLDDRIRRADDRWYEVYAPYFDISVEGKGGKVPDVDTLRYWSTPQWDEFRELIQDPILFWSPKECFEKWKFPDVPRCAGPDLLYVLSMGNESYVAKEAAYDNVKQLAQDLRDNMSGVIPGLVGALGDLAGIIIDPLLQAVKSSFRKGGLIAWILVGGGLYLANKAGWFRRRRY
ncbi:hypothetical protein LCGC14_2543200 [marine sediment metagenome]|uniref:Uncharacterized protein n=1 Tax=marine sediment metagenome TaxID=412755 RepID=A0A0F9D1R4_9ZZZZ